MDIKTIVRLWYEKWEDGDFRSLPISENFQHISPYGIIKGKKAYLNLVSANEDKFLGHTFTILDELYESNRACVRYTAIQGEFQLDVSEWLYINNNQITTIVAYYNIEEERISINS